MLIVSPHESFICLLRSVAGRAAQRLTENTKEEAKTIHRLLEIPHWYAESQQQQDPGPKSKPPSGQKAATEHDASNGGGVGDLEKEGSLSSESDDNDDDDDDLDEDEKEKQSFYKIPFVYNE